MLQLFRNCLLSTWRVELRSEGERKCFKSEVICVRPMLVSALEENNNLKFFLGSVMRAYNVSIIPNPNPSQIPLVCLTSLMVLEGFRHLSLIPALGNWTFLESVLVHSFTSPRPFPCCSYKPQTRILPILLFPAVTNI